MFFYVSEATHWTNIIEGIHHRLLRLLLWFIIVYFSVMYGILSDELLESVPFLLFRLLAFERLISCSCKLPERYLLIDYVSSEFKVVFVTVLAQNYLYLLLISTDLMLWIFLTDFGKKVTLELASMLVAVFEAICLRA